MGGMAARRTQTTNAPAEQEQTAGYAQGVDYVPSYLEFARSLDFISKLKKTMRRLGGTLKTPDFEARIIPGGLVMGPAPLGVGADAPDHVKEALREHLGLETVMRPGGRTWVFELSGLYSTERASTTEMREVAVDFFPQLRRYFPQFFDDQGNRQNYTGGQQGGTVGDEAHDLNALASRLGLTYEEAAAKLTARKPGRKVSKNDPVSVARRVVRRYEQEKLENSALKPSREVLDAFSIINKANYPGVKAKRAAKKLAM
jgi:hypothetical protein